jgi:hypothetical protein
VCSSVHALQTESVFSKANGQYSLQAPHVKGRTQADDVREFGAKDTFGQKSK